MPNFRCDVRKVQQFKNLTPEKVQDILDIYSEMLGIEQDKISKFYAQLKDKNYAILMSLTDAKRVKPFEIDKTGYGAMAAWITVEDVGQIRK